jgi:hypothetical protein
MITRTGKPQELPLHPHNYADATPLISVQAAEICIPMLNNGISLAAVFKSKLETWKDADFTESLTL